MGPYSGDHVLLRGTELDAGAPGESDVPVATLLRCEPQGLRLRDRGGEELLLAAGEAVERAELDLATGRVRVWLSPEGARRLGLDTPQLHGIGFELVGSQEELRRRESTGRRRLHLSAFGLHPAGRPDDAFVLSFEHCSRRGILFHLPEVGPLLVPWESIEEAVLDLLAFRLRVVFRPEARAQHRWLVHGLVYESCIRRSAPHSM